MYSLCAALLVRRRHRRNEVSMSLLKVRPDIAALEESKIVEVWRMGFDIPDVIGMWVGQGDLPTPRFICDAAAEAMARGETFYTHKRGIPELRRALIDYHR